MPDAPSFGEGLPQLDVVSNLIHIQALSLVGTTSLPAAAYLIPYRHWMVFYECLPG